MLISTLIVAWRNWLKNKVIGLIHIFGLSIGLAACMIIVLYTGHEYSFDKFHENADRIFGAQIRLKMGGDSVNMPLLNYSTASLTKRQEPSVRSFTRIHHQTTPPVIQSSENPSIKFSENALIFADSNFFTFFNFKLLSGNKNQVLSGPMNAVITRKAAKRYFSSENPVGKTLVYNNRYVLKITGIAENCPSNSSLNFDCIVSIESMKAIDDLRNLIVDDVNAFQTFFQLTDPQHVGALESTLTKISGLKNRDFSSHSTIIATSLAKQHVEISLGKNTLQYLMAFPVAAILILLISIINYVNLSTAFSSLRAKEIGIKKVLGAERKTVAKQFFLESLLYTLTAFLLGVTLCVVFHNPIFNFLGLDIDPAVLLYPGTVGIFFLLLIATVFLAGFYPALVLSAYKPVTILNGQSQPGRRQWFRKALLIVQFSIATLFIFCGLSVQNQLVFVKNKSTGIDRHNVLMVPFGSGSTKHLGAFKQQIGMLSSVEQLSVSLFPMYKGNDMIGIPTVGSNTMVLMPKLDVDPNFIALLGLEWYKPPVDSQFFKDPKSLILNQAALRKLGISKLGDNIDQFKLAGVLKDFNWSSLHNTIDALAISVMPDDSGATWVNRGGYLFIKHNDKIDTEKLLAQIGQIQATYEPEKPFEYLFLDDTYQNMYKAETRLLHVLMVFAGLAVFIACFGLFGFISLSIVQRTKEFGIRKCLGASMKSLIWLLSKDLITQLLLATILIIPFGYYLTEKWLQNFALRTQVPWWMFALSFSIILLFSLLSIGYHSVKGANTNPVQSLKSE